jgi:hypothetical protein
MHENDLETLQVDLDRLGQWAVENAMKINPEKKYSCKLHESSSEGSSKLCFWGPKYSGSEQLQIFSNNLAT